MSSFTRDQNANGALFAILGRAILASRYLLVVFFFGLAGGLTLYAVRFLAKLWGVASELMTMPEQDVLIAVLHSWMWR